MEPPATIPPLPLVPPAAADIVDQDMENGNDLGGYFQDGKTTSYKCQKCDFVSQWKSSLQVHMKHQHTGGLLLVIIDVCAKLYRCTYYVIELGCLCVLSGVKQVWCIIIL